VYNGLHNLFPENLQLVQSLEELRVSLKPKLGVTKIVIGQTVLHMKYIQFCLLKNLSIVWKFCLESDSCSSNKHLTDIIHQVLHVLKSENYKYGQQQIDDFWLELLRIKRIAQLEILNKKNSVCTMPELKVFEKLILDVSKPYSEHKDQVAGNLLNMLKQSIHVAVEPLNSRILFVLLMD
jgi:hypothetical protein